MSVCWAMMICNFALQSVYNIMYVCMCVVRCTIVFHWTRFPILVSVSVCGTKFDTICRCVRTNAISIKLSRWFDCSPYNRKAIDDSNPMKIHTMPTDIPHRRNHTCTHLLTYSGKRRTKWSVKRNEMSHFIEFCY